MGDPNRRISLADSILIFQSEPSCTTLSMFFLRRPICAWCPYPAFLRKNKGRVDDRMPFVKDMPIPYQYILMVSAMSTDENAFPEGSRSVLRPKWSNWSEAVTVSLADGRQHDCRPCHVT